MEEITLTAGMRAELRELIREVVSEEVKRYEHACHFGEGEEDIEVIRDNHRWLKLQRERSDKMSTAFMLALVTAITGGLLTAAWYGVRQLILHGKS